MIGKRLLTAHAGMLLAASAVSKVEKLRASADTQTNTVSEDVPPEKPKSRQVRRAEARKLSKST